MRKFIAYTASPVYIAGFSRGVDAACYALAYIPDPDMDASAERSADASAYVITEADRSVFMTGFASGWEQYMATHAND